MFKWIWEAAQRNKIKIGLVIQFTFQSLLLNITIQDWLNHHAMVAAWVLSIANGLTLAGILKSDKEVKLQQELKKIDE